MSATASPDEPAVPSLQAPRMDERGVRAAVTPGEIWLAAAVFVVLLVLRFRYLFVCRFDTDESQHLHVVWGWTVHLLPYRDLFDNHVPLFHILFAPILQMFGERADILIVMRFAMVPLWLGSLWCLYLAGKRAFSPQAGLWAAMLAASSARFFFKMGEFRTDVLWTLLWFSTIAILIGGRPSVRRAFTSGLVLGTALAVSLKTTIMLAALAVSAGVIFLVARKHGSRPTAGSLLKWSAAAVAGLILMPVLVIAYFAYRGALHSMYHCVIEHNALPDGSSLLGLKSHLLPVVLISCAAVALAFELARRSRELSTGFRRIAIILPMAVYYVTIRFLWPIVTAQDYAPLDPLFFVCLTPLLIGAGRYLAAWFPGLPIRLAPVCLLLGFNACQMFMAENPLKNSTERDIAMVRDVLKLTAPGEAIMDAKGETIYRRRAFFYVLETLTLKRMALGLLKDDIVPCLIKNRPPVVHGALRMPEDDQKWERANYLSVGTLDVLGKILPKSEAEVLPFQIVVPERYTIVANRGGIEGSLDGKPFTSPLDLAPGSHEFVPSRTNPGQRFAVIWARAAEKGYSPFPKEGVK
jgi:hypothetical protein